MLDIYMCSSKDSFIKFTKYEDTSKNGWPKGTTTFFFDFN